MDEKVAATQHLYTDLIQDSGDCQYVDVDCPEICGQPVQKHQLATHVANKKNYPVPCPNRYQIGDVEHNALKDHLDLCCLQVASWMWLSAMQAAVRSFRGKTWKSKPKRTEKSTWHRWHLQARRRNFYFHTHCQHWSRTESQETDTVYLKNDCLHFCIT